MTDRQMHPPWLARSVLGALLPSEVREEMEGDLLEGFREKALREGNRNAKVWYWRQVLATRPWALRSALNSKRASSNHHPSKMSAMNQYRFGLPGSFVDLKCAFRSFLRSPLHAIMTVAILAVGIGAVTLMFSALNASVLRPLPYPEPDKLVWMWKSSERVAENSLSYDDFVDYRDGVDAFEDIAAYVVFRSFVLVSGRDEAERISARLVTPGFFRTLGASPFLGRSFLEEEAVLGGPRVTVLSHEYWQTRLGGDPDIIDQTLVLDGEPTSVVGVMPAGFEFRSPVDIWLPAQAGAGYATGRGNNNYFLIARLEDGVSLSQAQSQVGAVAAQIQEANPEFAQWTHRLQPLHEVLFGDMRPILLILMGIVSLVPLLACANVASLTLARASARSTELATRLAIGANRGQVLRHLLAENLVLATLGGIAGLGIASLGGRFLRSFGPASVPRLDEIGVDSTVLIFALAVSLVLVPLFGILPALRGTGFNLADTLRFGGGRGGSERRGKARRLLVITQVALSMMLLITSGLFLRSFLLARSVDPGFETRSILTAGVQLPAHKYATPGDLALAWDQVLARLESVPGVEDAAGADWLPIISGGGPWNGLSRPDHPLPNDEPYLPATRKFITEDYFSTLGMTLKTGRTFGPDDRVGTPNVIVLSEPLAEALFPGEDPLGQPVTFWGGPFEVVGVAAHVPEAGLGQALSRPPFFVANGQYPQPSLRMVLRVSGQTPSVVTGAVRNALKEVDPDIALTGVQTMEAGIGGTLAQPRFQTALVGSFAVVGLLLAAFGLYGVLAYLVARRRHEIGIRMAVGAGGGDVLGLILGQGMQMVGVGAILGLVGGGVASVFLQGLLFGVSPADPLAMGGSTVVLLAVAFLASLVPASRAIRTDPLTALRAE
jgi:putative ABC transport system permease protein